MRTINICLLLIISISFSGCRKTMTLVYWLMNKSQYDLAVEVNTHSKQFYTIESGGREDIALENIKYWSKVATSPRVYIKELSVVNNQNVQMKKNYRIDTNWEVQVSTPNNAFNARNSQSYELHILDTDF
jgi:hypothetical protein